MTLEGRYSFDARIPRTVAVICSDGRLISQTMAFLASLGEEQADVLATPGGAIALSRGAETFQDRLQAQKRIRTLVDAHSSERILLFAHGGSTEETQCAMCRLIRPRDTIDQICQWTLEHLAEITRELQADYPRLEVMAFLATAEGGTVSFREVTTIL
jgi:hypothetical protein